MDRYTDRGKELNYQEAERYISEIPKFTKKHSLDHTREFIARLGDPARDRKVIHVAGTNGKGSVCAFMQAILMAEGKTVGMFTSPHLVRLNERIRIQGESIGDEEFLFVFEQARTVAEEMEEEGKGHPSYFEFLYGCGMLAFERSGAEYLILETGLGGRLDATNSYEHPMMSIVTSIGMDHMEYLGNSIPEIAAEKAGILRANVPAVCGGSSDEATAVIEARAREIGCPLQVVRTDEYRIVMSSGQGITFAMSESDGREYIFHTRTCAAYQAENAAIAIRAMQKLLGEPDASKWENAVAQMKWPGRMDEIEPGLIVDGAHNLAAIRRFVESVNAVETEPPVILFSAVADKDYSAMIRELTAAVRAKAYVVTKVVDKRGAAGSVLAELFRDNTDVPVYEEESTGKALARAKEIRGEGGKIYCLGSLYLVGEIKELTGGNEDA